MDKLTSLAISYPDFQLNQIIDPEQMDLNNLQIVNKINTVIKAINELIFGIGGASHITISPIPEFSDAKTVQQALQQIATFVKTLDADAKRQFAELVQKNNEQDGEIQEIKRANSQQDNRLQSLESTQANHSQRISSIEGKDKQQDNEIRLVKEKNSEQDNRLSNVEGTVASHSTQIQSNTRKNTEQDKRLVQNEAGVQLNNKLIKSMDNRVSANAEEIVRIKENIDNVSSVNPSVEVTTARTSAHTQHTYRNIGERLDDMEIPIKNDFSNQPKGAINFRVIDEEGTHAWENSVKLGDLEGHNNDHEAHGEMMAMHEMDETAHGDIREAIEVLKVHTHGKEDIIGFEHTHTKTDITDFAHTHDRSEITGFTHTHTASEVSGLPSSLPANGGNADTVGGVNPNEFARKNGEYESLTSGSMKILDTRNDNQPPSWYFSTKTSTSVKELKLCNRIGLPSDSGQFCTLETITAWNDETGGKINQIAYRDGKMPMIRFSNGTGAWGAWEPFGSGGEGDMKAYIAKETNYISIQEGQILIDPDTTKCLAHFIPKHNGFVKVKADMQIGSTSMRFGIIYDDNFSPNDSYNTPFSGVGLEHLPIGGTTKKTNILVHGATRNSGAGFGFQEQVLYVQKGAPVLIGVRTGSAIGYIRNARIYYEEVGVTQ